MHKMAAMAKTASQQDVTMNVLSPDQLAFPFLEIGLKVREIKLKISLLLYK